MIRRINYTGRRRISRDHVQIIIQEGNPAKFNAKLELAAYRLPADAIIFVEAYRQTLLIRFNYGTVSKIQPPSDLSLNEFESTEGILFRVKVTSQSPEKGKLLAEADRIKFRRTEEEEERVPLLPVVPQDLGHEITKIDFADEPRLLINSAVGDFRNLALSPFFICLIYPQVLREILTRILRIERYYDTDDPEDWKSRWLQYAMMLPGIEKPPEEDEELQIDDWIDEVVAAFSRKHEMLQHFQNFWQEE